MTVEDHLPPRNGRHAVILCHPEQKDILMPHMMQAVAFREALAFAADAGCRT